jgi:hypothetical protein
VWALLWLLGQVSSLAARRPGARFFAAQHLAFLAAVASGAALMSAHGWRLGHPRWLALKVGLVAFLFTPLEGFHAYVAHVWIPTAQRTGRKAGERLVERGLGMEAMIRTLELVLLTVAVPLVLWLSIGRPF